LLHFTPTNSVSPVQASIAEADKKLMLFEEADVS
jgi:hypothetical protein